MSITVEAALERLLAHAPPLEAEQVELVNAVGRVLVDDVYATMEQPPFDRSPLDGYAVIAEDIAYATPDTPVRLRVAEKLYGGDVPSVTVHRGEAVRLMTGSMLPPGADCVVRQEDTDGGEETVVILKHISAGQNYCRRGDEYGVGARLLSAGTIVDAAATAVAAGAGLTRLPVHRRLRAAILSTGDEVQQPGSQLHPGHIYDANTSYLRARLMQLGAVVTACETSGDTVEGLVDALTHAGQESDVILTTGGVSVGQKDLMELAARAYGAEIVFHGVSIKPGMPTLFARKDRLLILSFSGNPFSAAVPFELLFRPLLAKMTQNPSLLPKRATAIVRDTFRKKSVSRRFLRARCESGIVQIAREQSNGQMRSMVGCNCLVDIPAGTEVIYQGEQVDILWL